MEIMDDQELIGLLVDLGSDRAERRESLSDPDKILACICAFANDLPNHKRFKTLMRILNDWLVKLPNALI